MSVDTGNAVLVSGGSLLIGYGLSYFAFKKLVGDTYGKGKEKYNGIYFWFGFVAMIAFGQGASTVLNEVLFALTNNSSIRGDMIARGIVTLAFFPAVLALIAFVISRLSRKKLVVSSPVTEIKNDTASSSSSSSNLMVIFLLVVIVGLLAYNFFPSSFLKAANEKNFTLKNCTSCSQGNCKAIAADVVSGFKVTLNQVFIIIKDKDGQDRISIYPNDAKMKCAILPEKNFAFDCNSIDTESGLFSQTSVAFNGKDKFTFNFKQKLLGSSAPGIDGNWQCEVN